MCPDQVSTAPAVYGLTAQQATGYGVAECLRLLPKRSCEMHADLDPFMVECGTLWEKHDRETMRWQYLEGASRGLNDIFAPHRLRGFMAKGRPRSSQHQAGTRYHLTILTQACVLITARIRQQNLHCRTNVLAAVDSLVGRVLSGHWLHLSMPVA